MSNIVEQLLVATRAEGQLAYDSVRWYTDPKRREQKRAINRRHKAKRRADPIRTQAYREKKRVWDRNDRARNPNRVIGDRLRKQVHRVLAGGKSARTEILLGCTTAELVAHLLIPFPGSDLRQLLKTHQIDHIKPCNEFDLTKVIEQMQCFHYTNLQLLPAKENARKWCW